MRDNNRKEIDKLIKKYSVECKNEKQYDITLSDNTLSDTVE
jgi:hypothetical protein